ncbi:rod shape-determining protein MreD [Alkalibaculum sporogenes]|uniref:rod shape-determining protein MreD n=1 Tax=Alkalibaculum sporogenes TaxID=2655001 RepID=UPI00128ADFE1
MSILKLSLILLIELVLQSTVFQFLNFHGIYPDLVLITLICYSIILGKQYSYKLGVIIGLLFDIMFGNIIGIYALSFLVTAYLISVISSNMFKESLLAPISVFPIGVIINHSVIYLITYLLRINISLIEYITQFNIIYWVVNIITMLIAYPLILKFIKRYILKSHTRS